MDDTLKKLTKEIAMMEVENLKGHDGIDDAIAHIKEDSLHRWFISCVAAGMYNNDEAVEVANIVRSTSDICFSRWYD